jgi:hypothetical protein
MTAVVLIAVIVGHRAITFRTLALAAMIVLVLAPEALVQELQLDQARLKAERAELWITQWRGCLQGVCVLS